jgi:adenylate cyclase
MPMSLFGELKRRNVFKVAAAYLIVGWLIMQAGDTLAPALHLPEWVNSLLAFFLILGFPLALFFAWAFEMTPDGIKKEKDVDRSQSVTQVTGQKLNNLIIGILVLALGYFAIDKFVLDPKRDVELVKATQVEATLAAPQEEGSSDAKSIAVLPFINMSDDASNEFFSDGITEELLNLLSKIPELKVTSRSSAFSFKGQNPDIPTVAKKLKVDHILEGSVRKAGNRVRITAQLIKADSDVHIWSETYDRELDDVFGIQDEISREVVTALQIQLFGSAPTTAPTDTEAYTLYLKGKYFEAFGNGESWEAAESAFRAAMVIDPDYAPSWAALSTTLQNRANLGYIEQQGGFESARQAAIRALELDDTLADAWAALARIQFSIDLDWDRAEGTIRTALQYGPNNVVALEEAAVIARGTGHIEKALSFAHKAVELDPLSPSSLRTLGITFWAAGLYPESERVYRQILELYPDQVTIRAFIASVLNLQGKSEEAMQFIDSGSENPWQRFISALILHDLNRDEESELILQRLSDNESELMAYQIADIHAWRGDTDKSFAWLERAYQQKDGGISMMLFDPFLVSLHDDPRWEQVLLKVGMLDYWKDLQADHSKETAPGGGTQ